jgi:hypothetical protein
MKSDFITLFGTHVAETELTIQAPSSVISVPVSMGTLVQASNIDLVI